MSGDERSDMPGEKTTSTPVLTVVCGLPGAGKTTVGKMVADHYETDLLRTDIVRKDLFTDPDYTDKEERTVYAELLDRAREDLNADTPAVLDGTFHRQQYRDQAREMVLSQDASVQLMKVECSESVVRDRIQARTDDASDADFEIHQTFRETFEPVNESCTLIDNGGSLEATRRQVETLLSE